MKDDTCTVRDIEVPGSHVVDVPGFVRVLEFRTIGDGWYSWSFRLLILCDADPIVWSLRFEVVPMGESRPCLTGLTYLGYWQARGAVVFMHPPTRAEDTLWKPHQADMTLVEPAR